MHVKRRTVLLGAVGAGLVPTVTAAPARAAGLPLLAGLPAGAPDRRLFTPGEQRFAGYLVILAPMTNDIVDTDPYGFMGGGWWRTPAQPYNSRVQEHVFTLSWFYANQRAWNPYYRDSALLGRLDAALQHYLGLQNPDGSWFYARDGKRSFVDHFHTCFVMKALAKIEALTGNRDCTKAIEHGVAYYTQNLFDKEGIPKPFSKAPRLTVYKRELYDYAECINLAMLLRGRFPALDRNLEATIRQILSRWQTKEGSFRSRQLYFGWDNTPMHRWASAQLFRSLCLVLSKDKQTVTQKT